ncbi:MAG: class I SAM-dependent methyltransferase, partial [Armatimonadota bacterium]
MRVASFRLAFLAIHVGVWLSTPAFAAAGAESRAKAILAESNVRGGLVAHVGCGDGRLTAALGSGGAFLVHGVDASPANVAKARKHIHARGLYGKVSVDLWSGGRLPYTDSL